MRVCVGWGGGWGGGACVWVWWGVEGVGGGGVFLGWGGAAPRVFLHTTQRSDAAAPPTPPPHPPPDEQVRQGSHKGAGGTIPLHDVSPWR